MFVLFIVLIFFLPLFVSFFMQQSWSFVKIRQIHVCNDVFCCIHSLTEFHSIFSALRKKSLCEVGGVSAVFRGRNPLWFEGPLNKNGLFYLCQRETWQSSALTSRLMFSPHTTCSLLQPLDNFQLDYIDLWSAQQFCRLYKCWISFNASLGGFKVKHIINVNHYTVPSLYAKWNYTKQWRKG